MAIALKISFNQSFSNVFPLLISSQPEGNSGPLTYISAVPRPERLPRRRLGCRPSAVTQGSERVHVHHAHLVRLAGGDLTVADGGSRSGRGAEQRDLDGEDLELDDEPALDVP